MTGSDDATPSVAIFKQLALSCEAIEIAVRAGQKVDVEVYVAEFPVAYQDLVRPELEEVLAELLVTGEKHQLHPPDSRYEALHGYSAVQLLAHGGMGRISVVWDEAFSRQVALKEIHPDRADDERYQKRFLQESLITARLEHPGILPIYSSGANSDDQPFYTMRLVTGENAKTLAQAIQELHQQGLETHASSLLYRQLLRRVIDVCNTISYAHSQGVCHRDLKPANILIGPFSETLVVDWGLAKNYHDALTLTKSEVVQLGSLGNNDEIDGNSKGAPSSRTQSDGVGTRGFVAPESYRQESIIDWPRLDVYSLGAILYCVLTGQSPGSDSSHASGKVSKKRGVEDSDQARDYSQIVRPRRLKPSVSKALEAVCLKAMASEPGLRYPTPAELASDLERFLAGQPVSVLREGVIDQTIRWISNNRKLALLTFGLGSLLSFAVGVIAIQQLTHNATLAEKSHRLSMSLAKESELRGQEQASRELAQEQERIAKKRESVTLRALRTYTDAITANETLKNSKELGRVRRELLEKPIPFFEEILSDESPETRPSWEYIEQLAKMSEELAKLSFEYGDPLQCARWNDRSIELYTELLSLARTIQSTGESLDERALLIAKATVPLAGSYRLRGVLQMQMDRKSSDECLRRAMELISQVGDDPQWRESLLNERANIFGCQAILAAEQNDTHRMAESFDVAVKDRRELLELTRVSSSKSRSNPVSSLATRELELESLLQDQAHVSLVLNHGDIESHFMQFEKHIAFLNKRIESGISLEQNRLRLAWATRNLAIHLRSYGQIDKSLTFLQDALELRRQMTAFYPSVTRYRADLAGTAIDLAGTIGQLGKTDQAIEYCVQGIEEYRRLLEELPQDASYRVELVMQLHYLVHLCLDSFQDSRAAEVIEESFELARQILASNPSNEQIRGIYPELLWHRAYFQSMRGDWHGASESFSMYWVARSGSKGFQKSDVKPPSEILGFWEYCCLRTGDTSMVEQISKLQSELPDQAKVEQAFDTSWIGQVRGHIQAAEKSLRAADRALLSKQTDVANSSERDALGRMQEVLRLLEVPPHEVALDRKTKLEVWDLTMRNTSFVTVRIAGELERWPPEDQDAWKIIWQKLLSMPR